MAKKAKFNPKGKIMTPAQRQRAAVREKQKNLIRKKRMARKTKGKKSAKMLAMKSPHKNKRKLNKRQTELRAKRNKVIQQRKMATQKKALKKKATIRKNGGITYWDRFQKKIGYNNNIKTRLKRADSKYTKEVKTLKRQGRWVGKRNQAIRNKTIKAKNLSLIHI